MNYPTLAELLNAAAELRPLNDTASRVMALSIGGRFSAQQLAEVVVADPVLATRLLRVANSAFYGPPKRISSVRDAIVLIGFPAARSTVAALCVIEACPRSALIDGAQFWRHSVSVATLVEAFTKHRGADGEQAFTAGIVHNIGRLALAQYAPRAFQAALAHARAEHIAVHEAQREVLGYTDAVLGAALAGHWRFPDVLVEAIDATDRVSSRPGTGVVAEAVIEARSVVRTMGIADGIDLPEETPAPVETPAEWDGVPERVDAFLETALV
jgi:HD-like signal output (HDOD) protein